MSKRYHIRVLFQHASSLSGVVKVYDPDSDLFTSLPPGHPNRSGHDRGEYMIEVWYPRRFRLLCKQASRERYAPFVRDQPDRASTNRYSLFREPFKETLSVDFSRAIQGDLSVDQRSL